MLQNLMGEEGKRRKQRDSFDISWKGTDTWSSQIQIWTYIHKPCGLFMSQPLELQGANNWRTCSKDYQWFKHMLQAQWQIQKSHKARSSSCDVTMKTVMCNLPIICKSITKNLIWIHSWDICGWKHVKFLIP
jgi:hypothetical protein